VKLSWHDEMETYRRWALVDDEHGGVLATVWEFMQRHAGKAHWRYDVRVKATLTNHVGRVGEWLDAGTFDLPAGTPIEKALETARRAVEVADAAHRLGTLYPVWDSSR